MNEAQSKANSHTQHDTPGHQSVSDRHPNDQETTHDCQVRPKTVYRTTDDPYFAKTPGIPHVCLDRSYHPYAAQNRSCPLPHDVTPTHRTRLNGYPER